MAFKRIKPIKGADFFMNHLFISSLHNFYNIDLSILKELIMMRNQAKYLYRISSSSKIFSIDLIFLFSNLLFVDFLFRLICIFVFCVKFLYQVMLILLIHIICLFVHYTPVFCEKINFQFKTKLFRCLILRSD